MSVCPAIKTIPSSMCHRTHVQGGFHTNHMLLPLEPQSLVCQTNQISSPSHGPCIFIILGVTNTPHFEQVMSSFQYFWMPSQTEQSERLWIGDIVLFCGDSHLPLAICLWQRGVGPQQDPVVSGREGTGMSGPL